MRPRQEPLTLSEARREFIPIAKAFEAYLKKTAHLNHHAACLVATFGDTQGFVISKNTKSPWTDLLFAAAGTLVEAGCGLPEISKIFEEFVRTVVAKQPEENVSNPLQPEKG